MQGAIINEARKHHSAENMHKSARRQFLHRVVHTPLIVRVNSLTRKRLLSLLAFFYDPGFLVCQKYAQNSPNYPYSELVSPVRVEPEFGRFDIFRHYIRENLTMTGKHGKPPEGIEGYRVFLSARVVEHPVARRLGIRHLIINVYEGPENFSLIEGYPFLSDAGWVSGAFIRDGQWDERGIRWELIPQEYPLFIEGLKKATKAYHQAQLPYNYKKGPNSNSFIWWLLKQFGLDVLDLFSGLMYWGTDYWRYYPIEKYIGSLEIELSPFDPAAGAYPAAL